MASLRSAKMDRVECASSANGDGFTVKATCARSGLTKTYAMHTVCDAEFVDADFDGESMGVKLVLRAKALNRLLGHFASAAQDDVTITCSMVDDGAEGESSADGKLVTLSSYTNPAGGLSQALQTNISLKRDDDSILHYKNTTGRDVEVTVNLKDLRCVVHLCESSDVDVAIYCEQTGAPVVVKPTADFKMFQQRDGLGNAADAPVVSFHALLVLSSMPPKVGAANAAPSQATNAAPAREMPPPRPQSLANAPIGSQPWSAVPDSEDATQRDVGVEVAGPGERPWGADNSTIPNDAGEDDWLGAHDDEYVEATPPEKRHKT
jgi:cell cycle checkpoint control protein RAD9A